MADIGGKALNGGNPVIKRIGHVAQRHRKIADLILPVREIRDLLARLERRGEHADAAADKRRKRCGDGARKQKRQARSVTMAATPKTRKIAILSACTILSISPAWVDSSRTPENRAEALHRHRHRNDQLARFGDPDDRAAPSGQRIHHLGIDRSVSARRLAVKRQIGALEEAVEPCTSRFGETALLGFGWRQIITQNLATGVEVARIKDQAGVIIINARTGAGWRNQSA
jgi:hypothetical protein